MVKLMNKKYLVIWVQNIPLIFIFLSQDAFSRQFNLGSVCHDPEGDTAGVQTTFSRNQPLPVFRQVVGGDISPWLASKCVTDIAMCVTAIFHKGNRKTEKANLETGEERGRGGEEGRVRRRRRRRKRKGRKQIFNSD